MSVLSHAAYPLKSVAQAFLAASGAQSALLELLLQLCDRHRRHVGFGGHLSLSPAAHNVWTPLALIPELT